MASRVIRDFVLNMTDFLLSFIRSKQFVNKLLINYTDRHWKGTNWILMRFWHGDGYAFRYSVLPHHFLTAENLKSAANYTVYNIGLAANNC